MLLTCEDALYTGNGLVAGDAAATGDVVHGEGLAQILAHGIGEGTQAGVGTAAGAPGTDDLDPLGGILAALAAAGGKAHSQGKCCGHGCKDTLLGDFHTDLPPPIILLCHMLNEIFYACYQFR